MDDGGRAKRARQRAEEERREREQRVSEAEESQNEERKVLTTLHRESCHPLGGVVTTMNVLATTFFGGMVLVVLLPLLVSEVSALSKLASEPVQYAAVLVLVLAFALAGIVTRIVVASSARSAYRRELQWLRSLPFVVEDLERGVITPTSDKLLVVIIPEVRPPQGLQVMAMLTHVDPGGSVETRKDELRITARIAGEPESDVARVRARRLLFHDLVDGVLLPLHAQLPFHRIKTDSD